MNAPYEPKADFGAKIARKLVPLRAKRTLKFTLERPIVSFTFDDFPRSAITNGANMLEENGWLGTFYTAAGLAGISNHHGAHFKPEDLLALQNSDHEIAGHTYDHIDCGDVSLARAIKNIRRNAAELENWGVRPLRNFAYPYGTMSAQLKHALENQFRSMRGVMPGAHVGKADLNGLKSTPLYSGQAMANALETINHLAKRPGWLVLFAHDIRDRPSEWGCTPQEFQDIIAAVQASGAAVLTVDAALDRLEGQNA